MRLLLGLALMFSVLLASPVSALAQNGNANGNAGGNASVDGNGNAGANGNSGNAGNNGNADIVREAAAESEEETEEAPAAAEGQPVSDQDKALDAVKSRNALPLDGIVRAATSELGGEVIDAQLIERDGLLVYELKVLSPSGVLNRVYYDARSGQRVGGG